MALSATTRFRLPVKIFACLVLLFSVLVMTLQNTLAQTPSSPDEPTATPAFVQMTATALASDLQAAERILFLSSRDGPWRTYLINADSTNERLITAKMGAMEGYEAVLSPDHKHVAFIGYIRSTNTENAYLINIEGTQVTLLTEDPSTDLYITWLPNSKQIGFASYREEGMNIYVMNIDGGPITRLTPNDGSYNSRPLWSPNGEKIAFLSSKGGSANLYVMDADGSHVQQITDDEEAYIRYSWSPNSESLVFSSNRDGRLNIYTMTLEGGAVDQLTYRDSNYSPVWSPDGTKIAFISTRDGRYDLYTINANGLALKPLTKGYFIDFLCPTWMPDSQRIVAAGAPTGQSFPNGSYNIYVVNANGSGVMALTSDSNTDMLSHCVSLFG